MAWKYVHKKGFPNSDMAGDYLITAERAVQVNIVLALYWNGHNWFMYNDNNTHGVRFTDENRIIAWQPFPKPVEVR